MISTAWFIGDDDLTDARFIRKAVFVDEQGFSLSGEDDGTNSSSIHLVAYAENGEPAATGRILVYNGEFYIGRVAVLYEYRGKHFGSLIMRMLIRACYLMGGETQTVAAQKHAIGFYEKFGFTQTSVEFEKAGIKHVKMTHTGDIETPCNKNEKGL